MAYGGSMLRKNQKKQPEEPVKREPFTYIHKGTTLEGRIRAEGRVRVHGVVRGDVDVDGVVEVAPSGVIVGQTVKAAELRVLGRVEANVVVSGKVEIWNGGELVGDVKAAALDIEEGARFTGRSEMKQQGGGRAALDVLRDTVAADRRNDPAPRVTAGATADQADADAGAVSEATDDVVAGDPPLPIGATAPD